MPSIRKRLKKLTSSKKSKSTSDLDQLGPNDSGIGGHYDKPSDGDTVSQISEAMSERTDISAVTTESSYSYAEGSGKKKKRRMRLTFPKRKKKEKMVPDASGNVMFRSLSVEHDPRGNAIYKPVDVSETLEENAELKTEGLSKSLDTDLNREESKEIDGWRMSGLLESVDRTSTSSSTHDLSSGKDNLITAFEERRKKHLEAKPNHSSTPLKDEEKVDGEETKEKVGDAETQNKITAYIKPVNIQVSFNKTEKKREETTEIKDICPEPIPIANDQTDAVNKKRPKKDQVQVDEDVIAETRQIDPESGIEFEDHGDVVPEPASTCERSIICDIGKGKKVVIRHLTEVVTNGNLELSDKVSADDWLVLNMIKDDWVVVGYSKIGGEITELFDQSVEAI